MRLRTIYIFFLLILLNNSCDKLELQPVVKTGEVGSVSATSVIVQGILVDLGNGVSQHGHCFGTSPSPTISQQKSSLGVVSQLTTYTSDLTNLNPGVTYYARAYITSEGETYYGKDVSFTTMDGRAEVTTGSVQDVGLISANCGGEVLSEGGDEVTSRGVCWDAKNNFDLNDCMGQTSYGSGLGIFTGELTGLSPGITYHVKAYAVTNIETTYGEVKTFTTLDGIAELFTAEVTEITLNSAVSGGTINTDGGATIIARGICWSTSQNPTINDNRTTEGSGKGTFTSSMTGLIPNTTYYVRAYTTNSVGTYYGSPQVFTTRSGMISITTTEVSNISETSATSGGSISDDGGAAVTSRGICWSTSQNPTINDYVTSSGSGTGSFTAIMTGLSPNTTYYVKAYATNSEGTQYGSLKQFTSIGMPATLTTAIVYNISRTSAMSGGMITDDGGATVTSRGVCWSTSQAPTIGDYKTTDGSGTGSFSSTLTGLQCNQHYYVRAYATNSFGTSYGNQVSLYTDACIYPPTVITTSIYSITETSAWGGGQVTSDGGATVTSRGICWSTSQFPDIYDNKTSNGSGTGSYSSYMSGLTPDRTYYVRAYATNSEGTSYGGQRIFHTLPISNTLTDIDGNEYTTVTIGNQVWMAENLRVTQYSDGIPVPLVEDSNEWLNQIWNNKAAYCWLNNDPANGELFGALYTWMAASRGSNSNNIPSGIQGICPDGWHLPSDAEWKELEIYLGMSQSEADKSESYRGTNEGGKLKETASIYWRSPNTGANNETGFTALPAGRRTNDANFVNFTYFAEFYTATLKSYSGLEAYTRGLSYDSQKVYRGSLLNNHAVSVRCVKDLP